MVEQFTAPEDFSQVAEGQASEKTAKPVFNEITSKDIKDVFDQVAAAAGNALESLLPKISLEDKVGTLKDAKAFKCPPELKDPKELLAKLDKIEKPLTKFENKMLGNLRDSLRNGDLDATQKLLQNLAANPMSAARVLGQLQRKLENENPLRSVGWSMGKDDNGKVSINMKVSERVGAGTNAVTIVSMDSNGNARAQYSKNGENYKLNPADALASMLRPNPPRKK